MTTHLALARASVGGGEVAQHLRGGLGGELFVQPGGELLRGQAGQVFEESFSSSSCSGSTSYLSHGSGSSGSSTTAEGSCGVVVGVTHVCCPRVCVRAVLIGRVGVVWLKGGGLVRFF